MVAFAPLGHLPRRRRSGVNALQGGEMARGNSHGALDDLDRRLMEVLQADGRKPFTEIAAAFGVPESTIRARYKGLVDRGALKVIAVADPLKVGYPLMAMIGVRCTPAALLTTAKELEALPEVSYCVVVAGAYDLLIEVVCEDNDALLTFLTERLRSIAGVLETETFVYLRILKQNYEWGTTPT
jgi:Lrp/AsnC family transcriptional regulator for asnA, asnC and gidA